jgi:hypothetical protein
VPLVEAKLKSHGKAASNWRSKQAKMSTDIAVVAPIILGDKWQPEGPAIPEKLPSIGEIRKDLKEKGPRSRQTNHTHIIDRDVIATKYKDIVGSPILQYQDDIGDAQPFQ